MLGKFSFDFIDFVCSWADAGWGCGTCEHFRQLDSGGHDYSLHQNTREEKDIWQRQLSVSHRYPLLAIIPWVSMSIWRISACFCCLLHQRKFGKQQESQLCLWMSNICLLCLRWACVTFALWLHTERLCGPTNFFACTEGTGGSLGGSGFWQILSGPPHFPLQRKDEGGQTTDFSGRDSLVKVIWLLTLNPFVK